MKLSQSKTKVAGGIIIHRTTRKVLLVEQQNNVWSLPKGHIDTHESKLEAAEREILEESGIDDLELISSLGSYKRYKIGSNNQDDKSEMKRIYIFLFFSSIDNPKPQDEANPSACWSDALEVSSLLSHPKDKVFFEKFLQRHPYYFKSNQSK